MNTINALPEPAWDVSRLFPAQGAWSEEEYLNLPGNRLVEFDCGNIEVLEMPSQLHQLLVAFLYRALSDFVRQRRLGLVLFSPLPVKLWEGKMREPDILFMHREHANRRQENYWSGADLVMEVVSPNDTGRDKITKRYEYARAGIPEYWLVDPFEKTVTVFNLPEKIEEYTVHGVFEMGGHAESVTLAGFSIDLDALFETLDEE